MSREKVEIEESLKQLENMLISGEITEAETLFRNLSSEKQSTDITLQLEYAEMRILLNKSEFDTALRRLTAMMKKRRFPVGSRQWIECYMLRAFINQSLGHAKKAEKDLLKLKTSVEPDSNNYITTLFNLGSLQRDRGDFSNAEVCYCDALSIPGITPEMITRCSLAMAKIRSEMHQSGLEEFASAVIENAPRWGGWRELKTVNILMSLNKFRCGLYGEALKELFVHVRESDESDYALPRLRSRLALAEALIEIGDYNAALGFLSEVGTILNSAQHSSLKNVKFYAELLWFKADVRQNTLMDRYWEALDRLEIILAVVAKYPRPPGPAPYWLTIGEIQEKIGQSEQAFRSYQKAREEGQKSGSPVIESQANYRICALQWKQLTHDEKQKGAERNRILADTIHSLELISSMDRPELRWRIHYLRGNIFKESGEQYPAREEMKTAAGIAGQIILNFKDPSLQKLYRQTDLRTDAFIDLQEFFTETSVDSQPVSVTQEPSSPSVVSTGYDRRDSLRLQEILSSLYAIHSSETLTDMADSLLERCIQILDADRGRLILSKSTGIDNLEVTRFRSSDTHSTFSIPENWIRESSKNSSVCTYIRNPDDENPDTRCVLVSSIHKRRQNQGIVYLDRLKSNGHFTDDDLQILSTLTSVASVAFSTHAMRNRLKDLTDQFRREIVPDFPNIIGESPPMKDVFNQMNRVAPANVPVLIRGETGTGKDLVARTIHEISHRAGAPLVHLDCSSIPETLLESELFGIADGIATGVESRVGLMEYANGGTILLDEVGDIPLNTQAKLLRVLQEREFEPVGSDKVIQVDIRVISTTSRDLKKLISEGEMREDFYYRVSGVTINLPALHKRPGDVLLMARTFLQKYNRDFKKSVKGFTAELMDAMAAYRWPGNVRELDHLIRKAVLFSKGQRLTLEEMDLPVAENTQTTLDCAMKRMELSAVEDALSITSDDKQAAADCLCISLQELDKILAEDNC